MKKNKKTKYFFRTLYVLFFIFVALVIAYESGYYETKSHNRAVLTKSAMEKFENDLEQGQIVDIKDYLEDDKPDYSNGVTKLGNKLSNGISDFMTKGLTGIFDVLKGWFW